MKNLTKQLRRDWAGWQSFFGPVRTARNGEGSLRIFCRCAAQLHNLTWKQVHNMVSP